MTETSQIKTYLSITETSQIETYYTVSLKSVVEMRGGGVGGGVKPPKCARKCANFRNLKANVQILDRKTPPMVYPISPTDWNHSNWNLL